jgi:hypothetical protein
MGQLIKSSLIRPFIAQMIICVVPIVYMWDVLVVNQNAHLANPGAVPKVSTITDLDGAARMAFLLSDMSTPWANSTHISSPIGAGIWNFQSFSQSIQIVYLWIMSHLVNPMLAGNSLVLLGWVLTGTSVYLVARHIRCNKFIALACAIAVQMTPSIRFMAANFTSYVFIAIPIFNILFAIQYFEKQHWRKLGCLLVSLGITALFDPYWFLFSLFGVACVALIFSLRQVKLDNRLRTIGKPLFVVATYVVISWLARSSISFLNGRGNAREIGVSSTIDVQNSVLRLSNWASSDYMGIGYLALFLFVLAVVVAVMQQNFKAWSLALVAVAFILLSSKFTLPIFQTDFALAMWVRQLMPGVRFFDRAALVAVPLMVVVIAKVMQDMVSNFDKPATKHLLVAFAVTCLPLTYPNLKIPASLKSFDDWSEVRMELSREKDPKVLALPFSRRGRDWIEQANFRAPLVNDYFKNVMNDRVILHASNGLSAFAAYLGSIGVTHVFSIDAELNKFLDYELAAPRFNRVGTILLNGFGEGDYKLSVYKVTPQSNDVVCEQCGFGSHVVTNILVSGDLVYPFELMPDGEKRWWVGARNSVVNLKTLNPTTSEINRTNFIDINFSIVPCASAVHIVVKHNNFLHKFDLNQKNSHTSVRIPIGPNSDAQIFISAYGAPCSVANDPRQLLFQLSDFSIN